MTTATRTKTRTRTRIIIPITITTTKKSRKKKTCRGDRRSNLLYQHKCLQRKTFKGEWKSDIQYVGKHTYQADKLSNSRLRQKQWSDQQRSRDKTTVPPGLGLVQEDLDTRSDQRWVLSLSATLSIYRDCQSVATCRRIPTPIPDSCSESTLLTR